jgi:hypothetical protein
MPFSMTCTNRGCGDLMEPYLDPSTDKVFCSKCDKELVNITHFIKAQMKQFKQFKPKKNISFAVKCKKCNTEDRPLIKNKDIICPSCKAIHSHLSQAFKIMLMEQLKKASQDI